MMYRIIIIGIVQAIFLSAGQIFLKLAIDCMDAFCFRWKYFLSILTNWWLLAMAGSFTVAGLLWLYMLRKFDFSVAYPITSIAYIFGMLAAIFIFHEVVPVTRWIGVLLIILGIFFIVK